MRGGKRQGAGRQPAPSELKKRMVSIRLPEWLLNWMDDQPETNRAVLIEEAIKKAHLFIQKRIRVLCLVSDLNDLLTLMNKNLD